MTTFQKVIKYLAAAFAIFLCVSIIGGIITGLASISLVFSGTSTDVIGEMQEYPIDDAEISSLYLELGGAELIIKTSDKFSLESNHKYITVSTDSGRLYIKESKKPFFIASKGASVILTIPKESVFNEATIKTGAGKVEIEELEANILMLSLGAGEVEIQKLTANTRADIDGGAGEVTIKSGLLNNLDFDMGVGAMSLKSRVLGSSSFDFGVGEANLTLIGSRDDYRIKIDKGIGEAKLESESMSDDSFYGNGNNYIDIDGGVGSIYIGFANDEGQKSA